MPKKKERDVRGTSKSHSVSVSHGTGEATISEGKVEGSTTIEGGAASVGVGTASTRKGTATKKR